MNPDPHRLRPKGTATPHRAGLEFPPRLPFDGWQYIGGQLYLIVNTSAWWLGDWLVFGQDHYADTAAQLEAFEQAARLRDIDVEDWAVLVLQRRAFQALADNVPPEQEI